MNLVGSVMVIGGFLLPWFNFQRFGQWYFARGPLIVVNGMSDALAAFQKGDHVTAEAFAAFTLVLLPLVFALFSLASGIVALRRAVPLGLHSLSLASAMSGLIISSTLFSSAFANLQTSFYLDERGLGIPLMFAGFLVLIVNNVLASRIILTPQQHSVAQSKFAGRSPVVFSLLGSVFLIVGFFLPLYFVVPMNNGSNTDDVMIPTNAGVVTVSTNGFPSFGPLIAVSDSSQVSELMQPNKNAVSNDLIFVTGSLMLLLLPVIIGVLVGAIGVLYTVMGPRMILLGLYAPAIILTINGSLGYTIFQIYGIYASGHPSFEYGWGTVFSAIGDFAVLAGGVALALVQLRAQRQQ